LYFALSRVISLSLSNFFSVLKTSIFTATTFCLMLITLIANGQRRCGIVENTNRLRSLNLLKETDEQFEKWLKSKTGSSQSNGPFRKKANKYVVPVVFHIIHDGEPYGVGRNIPDEQIYSQLRVLNEDFQRRNADAQNTPTEFQSVAGNMDIEFVIARTAPDGSPTTGINRVKGTQSSWYSYEDYQFKSLSYWPAEDYINIWVLDLLDFLGFAQYPVSDLPGLEGSPDVRETDGLEIQYKAFGSIDDGNFDLDPQYNKGRTVPHEMGHFFGLRHIWGDGGGCQSTDYVDDTPVQETSTSGCPHHPHKTCNVNSMFMNFMDYTDDACMNLFTQLQVARMNIVIQNSPRRVSLTTSPGLEFPEPIDNDLALTQSAPVVQCTHTISPLIWVKNVGKNHISSAQIGIAAEGSTLETKNFPLDLEPGDSVQIQFSQTQAGNGIFEFDFEIKKTNGVEDQNFFNNVETLKVVVNESEDFIPFKEDFEGAFGDAWEIINPNGGMNWDTVVTNFGWSLNFNSFNNFISGDQSWAVSPTLDFSNAEAASMLFDVSYAKRAGLTQHLDIYVSDNCGQTYSRMDYVLPDAPESAQRWVPDEESDWFINEYVDLSSYAGQDDIRIAFVARNTSSNDLYLDNIELYTVEDPRSLSLNQSYSIFGYNASDFSASTLKIGFHLDQRQNIHAEIIDTHGSLVETIDWSDVLNQVYDLPIDKAMARGVYLLRVTINGKTSAQRFFNTN